jgi:hypothetical protein
MAWSVAGHRMMVANRYGAYRPIAGQPIENGD